MKKILTLIILASKSVKNLLFILLFCVFPFLSWSQSTQIVGNIISCQSAYSANCSQTLGSDGAINLVINGTSGNLGYADITLELPQNYNITSFKLEGVSNNGYENIQIYGGLDLNTMHYLNDGEEIGINSTLTSSNFVYNGPNLFKYIRFYIYNGNIQNLTVNKILIYGYPASTSFSSTPGSDLILSTGNDPRFVIKSLNGFVGVGCTPSRMLHVLSSDPIALRLQRDVSNSNGPEIAFAGQYGEYVYMGPANSGIFSINNHWDLTGNINHGFNINFATNTVGIGITPSNYKLTVAGDIYANGGWLRTSGNAGWYSESYGGGFYMIDNSWIRTYGSKNFYHDAGIMRTDGSLQVGPDGNRFVVTQDGKVGIGTTTLSEKLEVAGNVKATSFIGDGSRLTGINSSQWTTTGNNIYYNPPYGCVGIGTATPDGQMKLDVNGGIKTKELYATTDLTMGSYNAVGKSITSHNGEYIRFYNNNLLIGAIEQDPDNSVFSIGGSNGSGSQMHFKATTSGNTYIGIGTKIPQEKLEVMGNVRAYSFIGDGSQLTGVNSSQWTTNASGINYSGNVGIGIADPGTKYKLNVYGSVRANEVIVNTDGSDFVFDPNYKLRTLKEVETFIKQNKHLPEITPAAEMQANGVGLAELQTKLLQKLEEMTLYIIEQNKKIEQQSEKIQKLEEKVERLSAVSK